MSVNPPQNKQIQVSGNVVLNSSFEQGITVPTASLFHWDDAHAGANQSLLATQHVHSGTHSCNIFGANITQNLTPQIPVNGVTKFSFWNFGNGTSNLFVYYSDASHSTIPITATGAEAEQDVTASLTAGKTIDHIIFSGGNDNPNWIDDVTMNAPVTANRLLLVYPSQS